MPHADDAVRRAILDGARQRRDQIVADASALIAVPSPNPPLATGAVAAIAAELIGRQVPDAELSLHDAGEGVVNVVARLPGSGPGRRLVFSGHLDTYPVDVALPWTTDPFGGEVRDGRLYGRGAADMKGGIAASLTAFAVLSHHREAWPGEVILALSGDEESMGRRGAHWLLENLPHVRGDAVVIGDAGSPMVVRFGEKGFLWIEVDASGQPGHGAHVHLGVNAIDRLRAALDAVTRLRDLNVPTPDIVRRAIEAARPVSEPLSGRGEAATLARITVNIGQIAGGTSMNLIPAAARAGIDIRLPVGTATEEVEAALASALSGMNGVTWRVLRRYEPSFTDPAHEIVRAVATASTETLERPPAVNMRVGGSDARIFRAAGIPTVVYGPTPHNMGGADEYALIEELHAVATVHALSAFDYLHARQSISADRTPV